MTPRFQKGGRVAQLIEAAECRVLYLPPYSPDFNRIEKCWAWLRSRIRKLDLLHESEDSVPVWARRRHN
ncbi:transposase [Coleofasciculus sp. FACHB-64]|uniref:transposase n=1 Tax=Cyanophyceae TaxID=3028117 RepID=UPI0032209156